MKPSKVSLGTEQLLELACRAWLDLNSNFFTWEDRLGQKHQGYHADIPCLIRAFRAGGWLGGGPPMARQYFWQGSHDWLRQISASENQIKETVR